MRVQADIRDYIVENILFGDDGRLGPDTPFQEGGILDSTGFLEIITFIEEKFGITVADSEVVPQNFRTLQTLSDFVENKLSTTASPGMDPGRCGLGVPVSSQGSPCVES